MYLMVLKDGETFTTLEGCKIVEVPDDFEDDTVPDDAKVVAVLYVDGSNRPGVRY